MFTVLKEISASKAALRLSVSQSAVSHTLDRLRLAFYDALFVRDDRGIIPTAKAASLRKPVESISGLTPNHRHSEPHFEARSNTSG